MSTYLIALSDRNEAAWDLVKKNWPGCHHIIDERLAMVSPSGISTASEISQSIGISTGLSAPSGIVVEFFQNACSGVLSTQAVDWLRKVQNG